MIFEISSCESKEQPTARQRPNESLTKDRFHGIDELVALAARGGRTTRARLAQALEMPTFRLGGLVSATRRVLNLDQAQVLRDDGDDIVLDEGLIRTQFALRGD